MIMIGKNQRNRRIEAVVTGMHRSGTTWFGALIDSMNLYAVIHEPFNRNHGLLDTPRWYLDAERDTDRMFFEDSVNALCDGTARFRRPYLPHAKMKSIVKMILGTGAERIYRAAISSKLESLVLKDPFLLKFVPALSTFGIKSIIVVRHPAAIYISLKRMGWKIDIDDLAEEMGIKTNADESHGDAVRLANYWSLIYEPALRHSLSSVNPDTLFVSHEFFFGDVEAGCHRIAHFLGLNKAPDSMLDYARRTTTASTVNPSDRKVHQLERNSQVLATSWRNNISADLIDIFDEACGNTYEQLMKRCVIPLP